MRNQDRRLLIVVGPCSIHDLTAAKEYAIRLKILAEEMQSHCFIVMRAYFEKPRTGHSWRGWISDPDLNGTCDIKKGIFSARDFLMHLASEKLPAAMEFIDPFIAPYLADLITWGAIGARTVTSPTHRQLASNLNLPIGFKNGVDGDVPAALQAMLVAKQPHIFLSSSSEGHLMKKQSAGNFDTHIVLRGGTQGTNYENIFIKNVLKQLQSVDLTAKIMIDCAHANSLCKKQGQQLVWQNTLRQIASGETGICGLMIESHLEEGNQPQIPPLRYGVSITDPCISWVETERLIRTLNTLPTYAT